MQIPPHTSGSEESAADSKHGGGTPGTGRRTFLNWFLGLSAGALASAVFYPILRYISPPRVPEAQTHQVNAGSVDDPELIQKEFKIIRFGNKPVIVLRLAENDVRAFSAVCTHLSCIVGFRKDKQLIWCNCHNGVYNLHGINIGGPPPRPLTPFKVDLVAKSPGKPKTIIVSKT